MRKTNRILLMLIMLLAVYAAFPAAVYAASSISAVKAEIFIGETMTLKINGTTKAVKWSSKDESVAGITSRGVLTGRKAGSTIVTAKAGAKTFRCAVTVKKAVNLGKYIGKKFSMACKAFPSLKDKSRHGNGVWTDGVLRFGGKKGASLGTSLITYVTTYGYCRGYSIYGIYPGMKKADAIDAAKAAKWTQTGDYRWGRVSFRNVSGRDLYIDLNGDRVIAVTAGKWEDD